MKLLSALVALSLFVGCSFFQGVNSETMLVVFSVQPEKRAEFIEELNKILVDTRAYNGCMGVAVWTNEEDADEVTLYEQWLSRDHQASYLNWRIETGNTAHLKPFLKSGTRFLWVQEH